MTKPIVEVEDLGKWYRIPHEREPQAYRALRDVLTAKLAAPLRACARKERLAERRAEDFWALRNLSFQIQQGEVVGIIGRNGAGKSTLLKVLSRITEPSAGRVILRGRVASLLEVGTGFHPELTGRENIFLNGAILGMSRAEVRRKFDEIVAFAEVSKFLDTPVKRYSSGMYVRLAFAVAAHLEPELLIVDEVLAVGDGEFQKKCIGKMQTVAHTEGRTVLFVSHNMPAVLSLCGRGVLLDEGRCVGDGPARQVVNQYLARGAASSGEKTWDSASAPGTAECRLVAVRVRSRHGAPTGAVSSSDDIAVDMEFVAATNSPALCVGFDLANADGTTVLRTYQTDANPARWLRVNQGWNLWRCIIPKGLLNGGTFSLSPRISIHNVYWIAKVDDVVRFDVLLDHGDSPLWNSLSGANRPGTIAPILEWSIASAAAAVGASTVQPTAWANRVDRNQPLGTGTQH